MENKIDFEYSNEFVKVCIKKRDSSLTEKEAKFQAIQALRLNMDGHVLEAATVDRVKVYVNWIDDENKIDGETNERAFSHAIELLDH